ncbi:MAG TPA: hypothetical protein VGS12_05490 [Caulobacteraceae bacterium]|nr:hypothetical protein [Caulobacteraceae bacterium]
MTRFRDQRIIFANGVEGRPLEIATANPANYFEAMRAPDEAPPLRIDGQLFLPPGDGPFPAVIVVPGSLGVAPLHLAHAETINALGAARSWSLIRSGPGRSPRRSRTRPSTVSPPALSMS